MRGAVALLFLGLLLAACSDGDDRVRSPTTSRPAPTAPAPTVAEPPTGDDTPLPPPRAGPPRAETRDLMDLARRLRGLPAGTPRDAAPRQEPLPVGHRQTFQVVRLPGPGEARRVPPQINTVAATLRLVTPHAYFYLEDSLDAEDDALERAGRRLEEDVYPQISDTFGRERSPGVDGDPHITILIASLQNMSGYVSPEDGYPRVASPLSNEREMVYLDASIALPADETYARILSHELQHLVHYGIDPDEELWVQEGLSEMAENLGRDLNHLERSFLSDPDVQLNAWDPDGFYAPHYGASGLFFRYLIERASAGGGPASGGGGPATIRDLVSEPGDGIAGIEAFLSRHLPGVSFTALFADWATANYLDLETGPYGYREVSVQAEASRSLDGPAEGEGRVRQFAVDYIEVVQSEGEAVFTFDGATTVGVLAPEPHSGRGLWWSNRGDAIDTTLTRELDLRDLPSATLTFWTWYDIESWYDYGYVEVSADGGETWQVLPDRQTTEEDPLGLAYGPGYTGISGNGEEPAWAEKNIDLTPFAGQRVLLRFEYVTDSGLSTPGWAIDDIAVPELAWLDDAESDGDWEARGFRRIDGPLPQRFILRLIEVGRETRVTDVPLDADNRAEIRLSPAKGGSASGGGFGAGLTKAVILIAAATEGTSEPATYRYSLLALAP